MQTQFHQFNPKKFSFRKDPVLVLENFWTEKEMETFRAAMTHSTWTGLLDMPAVSPSLPRFRQLAEG